MFANQIKTAVAVTAVAVMTSLSGTALAGDVTGAGCFNERVRARITDVYRMTFQGGVPAAVAIRGDHDTDLDLIIRDSYGNAVCVANGSSDVETCSWIPRFTQAFEVRVQNLGAVYNEYRLCTN